MLHKAIFNELTTSTATAQYLAGTNGAIDRVFPGVIPQKVPKGSTQTPALTYEVSEVSRQTTYCGKNPVVRTTMRFDIYSPDYNEVKEVAAAVRELLSDFSGALGGIVEVRTATLENEFDVQDFEPGLYRVSQSWSFWHVE